MPTFPKTLEDFAALIGKVVYLHAPNNRDEVRGAKALDVEHPGIEPIWDCDDAIGRARSKGVSWDIHAPKPFSANAKLCSGFDGEVALVRGLSFEDGRIFVQLCFLECSGGAGPRHKEPFMEVSGHWFRRRGNVEEEPRFALPLDRVLFRTELSLA